MKVCGPKYALCGLIVSSWGIVQLVLMGIFFWVKSVALIEDVPLEGEEFKTPDEFYSAIDRGYMRNAYNCWIAACIYILTLLFSGTLRSSLSRLPDRRAQVVTRLQGEKEKSGRNSALTYM